MEDQAGHGAMGRDMKSRGRADAAGFKENRFTRMAAMQFVISRQGRGSDGGEPRHGRGSCRNRGS